MSDVLDALARRGVLSLLDKHFALSAARIGGERDAAVILGAAFASRAVQRGHVCVDLNRLATAALLDDDEQPVTDVALPPVNDWLRALSQSPLVAAPGEERATPLVLDDRGRLYLWRYFDYQTRLARRLGALVASEADADDSLLASGLARLFDGATAGEADPQRIAAALAVLGRFAVISGGPGTGKTHTVVKVLALIHEQHAARRERCRLLLVAPTGKAAQRLAESVGRSLGELGLDEVARSALSVQPSTIHKALGWLPRTPTRFFHDAENPLPAEVVLCDEASMVDLALMTKLAEAIPPTGRFVLLGDRDQLASVEAGAILGDLYHAEADHRYSAKVAERLERAVGFAVAATSRKTRGIADCMVHFEKSYRYANDSGIGAVARAVNAGDEAAVLSALDGTNPDVRLAVTEDERTLIERLRAPVVEGYAVLAAIAQPRAKLDALDRFRVLCAHRRGPFGAQRVNAVIGKLLEGAGLAPTGDLYEGRPIIVTQNDHQLGLMNGDVGVFARDESGRLKAFFSTPTRALRSFSPARLPPVDTVFAMTVHKSQGSEFDSVVLVLPAKPSPIVTRELLYTGVTRARKSVLVTATEDVVRHAVRTRIERASGLRDALWGNTGA